MKMLGVLFILLVVGCAPDVKPYTSPERRENHIKSNPHLMTPEIIEGVRGGYFVLGMAPLTTRYIWGKPSKKSYSTSRFGRTTIYYFYYGYQQRHTKTLFFHDEKLSSWHN